MKPFFRAPTLPDPTPSMNENPILDVAIVGAGAAGTYAAWRLAPQANKQSIKVFDYLKINGKSHVGGRLWSEQLPGLGGTRKAEMGGMRYLTNQPIVTNLLKYLVSNDEPQLYSVPFDVDSRNNIFNLRGKVLRLPEISDPAKVPYKLGPLEAGMSPGELLLYAIETIVPNAAYLTSKEWLEVKKTFEVEGYPLYQMGFWNIIERVLTNEGYSYVLEGQGYNTIPSNWNAADAMEWTFSDFGPNVSYQYVHGGYQELPETLLRQAQKQGVEFCEGLRLQSWQPGEDGVIDLVFEERSTGKSVEIRTRKLILATPRRSLELIDMPKTEATRRFYNELLPAVQPQPMFKFFLGYSYPWWRILGLSAGRTITDNPLRQIYYWGSNYQKFFEDPPSETNGVPNDPENSVLMIYLDGRDVSFWQPLFELLDQKFVGHKRPTEDDFDVLKVFAPRCDEFLTDLKSQLQSDLASMSQEPDSNGGGSPQAAALKQQLGSTERSISGLRQTIETITELLKSVHALNFLPDPYCMAFADWTADPFGGAYNLWRPGYKSWEVSEAMLSPMEGLPVYVCGEAYSVKQGWVEGAFETTESMLQKNFGLTKPDWLPTSS